MIIDGAGKRVHVRSRVEDGLTFYFPRMRITGSMYLRVGGVDTMCELRLEGKVALVTGAGRGIGKAIALRLAEDGARVVVNSYQENHARGVGNEIRQMNGSGLWIAADVSQSSAVDDMFNQAVDAYGQLDILVTNAGISEVTAFEDLGEEHWNRIMAVNAKGTYLCLLAAARHMVPRNYGRIITIGSGYSIRAGKDAVVYSASKFAVRGLTQAFAKELAPNFVTVNCVCPGFIWTDMWEETDGKLASALGLKKGEVFDRFTREEVLIPKRGLPEYIAPVVAFLASDDAHYITGQTIPVGGGATIV